MILPRNTPLLVLAFSFLSACVAQDGFTYWVNPNSSSPIAFLEGQTVTLRWVTDFPAFNIVLYQNLGDSYAEFVSEYLLEEGSGINSYDWIVAPIQDNTMTGNLSFHLDLTLVGNQENGANSQEFLILPNGNNTSPTSSSSTNAYPIASGTATAYASYPYPVTTATAESGVEPATTTLLPSDVPDTSDTSVTVTASSMIGTPTAAGGAATVSTRSYSSTASAAQQTGTPTATASGPTASAFTGEGTRNFKGWGFAAVAAVGGAMVAL